MKESPNSSILFFKTGLFFKRVQPSVRFLPAVGKVFQQHAATDGQQQQPERHTAVIARLREVIDRLFAGQFFDHRLLKRDFVRGFRVAEILPALFAVPVFDIARALRRRRFCVHVRQFRMRTRLFRDNRICKRDFLCRLRVAVILAALFTVPVFDIARALRRRRFCASGRYGYPVQHLFFHSRPYRTYNRYEELPLLWSR